MFSLVGYSATTTSARFSSTKARGACARSYVRCHTDPRQLLAYASASTQTIDASMDTQGSATHAAARARCPGSAAGVDVYDDAEPMPNEWIHLGQDQCCLAWCSTPDDCGWQRADDRLATARACGARPVIALGAGLCRDQLLASDLPARLSHFAAAVALRYPWLAYCTPVSEPLAPSWKSCKDTPLKAAASSW